MKRHPRPTHLRAFALAFIVCGLLAGQALAQSPFLLERFDRAGLDPAEWRVAGDAVERLGWSQSQPAFPGDRPGALRVRYDASAAAGWVGRSLPEPLPLDQAYVALFVFEIRSEGFFASPDAFFQISGGLWNSQTTGLERTGNFTNSASDSFELIEWAWFPNVSPFFGGPFFSPLALGAADTDNPFFAGSGAFANGTFGFGPPVELPFDRPLVVGIANLPERATIRFEVFEIIDGKLEPITHASTQLTTAAFGLPELTVDTVGLTLWKDGYGGETSGLVADIDLHILAVQPVTSQNAEQIKDLLPELLADEEGL